MKSKMSEINLWVRANLENYDPDTLALIPIGAHEEYSMLMKERAQVKAIATMVLERVYQSDEQCREFFSRIQDGNNV